MSKRRRRSPEQITRKLAEGPETAGSRYVSLVVAGRDATTVVNYATHDHRVLCDRVCGSAPHYAHLDGGSDRETCGRR